MEYIDIVTKKFFSHLRYWKICSFMVRGGDGVNSYVILASLNKTFIRVCKNLSQYLCILYHGLHYKGDLETF